MEKKPEGIWEVRIYGLLAVVWTLCTVLLLIDESSVRVLVFQTLCNIVWIINFVIRLHRYRRNKK